MQYVNDDMDDVFRRAAEDYPLDTKGADWNKVLVALGGTEPTNDKGKRSNKNGRFLWLLLLLPLGFICNRFYSSSISGVEYFQTNSVDQSSEVSKDKIIRNTLPKGDNSVTGNVEHIKTGKINTTLPESFMVNSHAGTNQHGSSNSATGYKERNSVDHNSPAFFVREKMTNLVQTNSSAQEETLSPRTYVTEIFSEGRTLKTPSFSINSSFTSQNNPFQSKAQPVIKKENTGKFYAGVVAGIDFTTIRFQKVDNKGHDYGILLGYQLNKTWGIESGIFLSNKYYYTDGKYLNTSKIHMPPNSRIDEASGDCKMIEVVISALYNFPSHKKSSWFTTVGASSYFIKEEKYIYQYYYGTYGPVPHDGLYKNSSNHFFSNINISIGYTKKLGNFADLRIEPYLKAPVSGMGITKLPLFSTGIHVGVVKKF